MISLIETLEISELCRWIRKVIPCLFRQERETENHSMIGAITGTRRCAMLVSHNYLIKIAAFLFVWLAPQTVCGKPWRHIVPLHTSRVEVEKTLGSPFLDNGDTVVYDSQDERVSVEYSKGRCREQWRVRRNVVLTIWVTPKSAALKASDLPLDNTYKMTRDEHRPEVIHYRNEIEGVEYDIDEPTGTVGLVKYFPSANDKTLLCHKTRRRDNKSTRR